MPPVRRSRSRSITAAPPRPDSSNSTASLHSYGSRVSAQEPGAPYPAPRAIARSNASHGVEDPQILSIEQANMVRLLQAENAQSQSHNQMGAQMGQASNQMPPHQQHMQHDQTAYYAAPQNIPYEHQHMDYSFNAHPPQHQQRHSLNGMTPMMELDTTKKPRLSTGQANENELQDMLNSNISRSLEEIAAEVVANERTSHAEKTKQLFAMLWYVMCSAALTHYSPLQAQTQPRSSKGLCTEN